MKKLQNSKISNYESQVFQWRSQEYSYRKIANLLKIQYNLDVSHNAIYSFLKVRESASKECSLFYKGLPEDIKAALLKQLNVVWTHNSTALEGNTITLGETANILEVGLTISGKSLKEHEEIYGHAQAVELILSLLNKDKIDKQDLFDLHSCVMHKVPIDSLRPVGKWKQEYNGTTGVRDNKTVYMEFASPVSTPKLMQRWVKEFNRKLSTANSPAKALNVYTWTHMTFVRVHPFFDGNGRIARLISNLPLLKCGHPPLLISPTSRIDYINTIWNYQNEVGVLKSNDPLLPTSHNLTDFKTLLKREWQEAHNLVKEARRMAQLREAH
jgi:Fic family protein